MFCDVRETSDGKSIPLLKGTELLWDDYIIEKSTNLSRFIPKPIEKGAVIVPHEEFENNLLGFPGSVSHNGSHFLIHYRANYTGISGGKFKLENSLVIAASTNGVTDWSRELVRMTPEPGPVGTTSGYIAEGVDTCVLDDRFEKNLNLRYKMVYNCGLQENFGPTPMRFKGYRKSNQKHDYTCMATSKDGIIWKDHGPKYDRWTDTQACLHHEGWGENYTYFLRREFPTELYEREIRGTQIVTVTDEDFHKYLDSDTPMPFEHVSEFYLDRYGKFERYTHQLYAFSGPALKHHGVYVTMPSILNWMGVFGPHRSHPEYRDLSECLDCVQPYFVTSRSLRKFNFAWIYAQHPIPLAREYQEKEKHRFQYIVPAAQMLTRDGYHWLYYTTNFESHSTRWARHHPFQGKVYNNTIKIWLAKFPEDRLIGIKANNQGGLLVTKTLKWPSDSTTYFKLNAEVKSEIVIYLTACENVFSHTIARLNSENHLKIHRIYIEISQIRAEARKSCSKANVKGEDTFRIRMEIGKGSEVYSLGFE
ncbi:hypothetical protein AAMO2058_001660700 [Amorphochlora amoebiformis]